MQETDLSQLVYVQQNSCNEESLAGETEQTESGADEKKSDITFTGLTEDLTDIDKDRVRQDCFDEEISKQDGEGTSQQETSCPDLLQESL